MVLNISLFLVSSCIGFATYFNISFEYFLYLIWVVARCGLDICALFKQAREAQLAGWGNYDTARACCHTHLSVFRAQRFTGVTPILHRTSHILPSTIMPPALSPFTFPSPAHRIVIRKAQLIQISLRRSLAARDHWKSGTAGGMCARAS